MLAYLDISLPIQPLSGDDSREKLLEWQGHRCASCGSKGPLVEDHDHNTGLTRGYLCKGCNIQEGYSSGNTAKWPVYRLAPPTKILGLDIQYDSWQLDMSGWA